MKFASSKAIRGKAQPEGLFTRRYRKPGVLRISDLRSLALSAGVMSDVLASCNFCIS